MAGPDRKRYYFKHLDFDGYWKIIWFGRITRLREGTDTVSIYCYLGKLSAENDLAFEQLLEHKSALIPIGDLTVLHIGAVLKDGYLQHPEELPARFNKTKEITVDLSKSNIEAFPRNKKDASDYIVPFPRHWTFYQEPQADAYVLGIKHGGNPFGVVIPCSEILRFFYCYASNIAKVVTSHRILKPSSYLYSTKKSYFDASSGIVTLKPRTVVSDESAIFLACFVSGYFKLERAQAIPKMIATISQSDPERPFVAFPPLDGELTLQVACVTLNTPQGEQIIISKILSADIDPNFQSIAIGNRVIDKGDRQASNSPRPKRHLVHVKNQPLSPVRLNSGAVNPALGEENQYDSELAGRFPAFRQITRVAAGEIASGDSKVLHSSIEHQEGSTNDKTSSESKNHLTRILPSNTAPENPDEEELSAFERIAKALRRIKTENAAEVKFLKLMKLIQKPEDKDDPVVYNLPRIGHEESWAYINRAANLRRRIIIASIAQGGDTRYLIEFEQKASGECSTLLLWDPIKEVPDSEIVAAVEELIGNGATYLEKNTFGHAWSKLRHSWKKNEHLKPEHFLKRIFESEPVVRDI